jgi:short-subunit dehydrogenase
MSVPTQEVAVIAGVGPGLGASLARKFAREGCAITLLARSADFLNALAEELRQSGANVLPVPADLTDAEAVTKAFALVRSKLGPISILINHVGSGVNGGGVQVDMGTMRAGGLPLLQTGRARYACTW